MTTGSWHGRQAPASRRTWGSVSYGQDAKFEEIGRGRLLGPDTTYIHCTTLNDTEIQMIVDTGGTVSLAIARRDDDGPRHAADPEVPRPRPAAEPERRRRDERPDDMFNQMRSVIAAPARAGHGRGQDPVHRREVLACATIEGARANGLDAKVGSLTPGKQADIILLRTDRMNVTPLNDPATAVVAGMDTGNVDTVLIAGRVMKRGGKLLHVDWPAVRRLASESRDHVVAKSGFKPPKI